MKSWFGLASKDRRGAVGTCFSAILLFVAGYISFIDCKAAVPEVFARPALTSVSAGVYRGEPYSIKTAYFVVANPPQGDSAIRVFAGRYARAVLSADKAREHTTVFLFFYRETAFTPRNYAESSQGYFAHDRIEDHARDLLVVVRWTRGEEDLEFEYYPDEGAP